MATLFPAFVCRSCQYAVRKPIDPRWRQFSSSARYLKKPRYPTFNDSSSPELTTLLERIRSKRILPSFLNDRQYKLVISTKKRAQLESEPVYATINDEEVRLQHVDLLHDIPPASSFLEVIEMTKTPQDWSNIPPLLEGLHNTGFKNRPNYKCAMVNAAGKAAMFQVVLRCLQQVETTGFSMRDRSVRTAILAAPYHTARAAGWTEDITQQSFKYLQQVLNQLENPAHLPPPPETSFYRGADDTILTGPLEVAARRVKDHLRGVDEGGIVALYTTRLVAILSRPDAELQSTDSAWDSPPFAAEPRNAREMRTRFFFWKSLMGRYTRVQAALTISRDLVGESLPEETQNSLKAVLDKIDERLKVTAERLEEITSTPDGAGLEKLHSDRGMG